MRLSFQQLLTNDLAHTHLGKKRVVDEQPDFRDERKECVTRK